MELKRVVVTGLGALTPIGNTKDEYWNGLVNGKSGAAPITYFDAEKFKTQFAYWANLSIFLASILLNSSTGKKLEKWISLPSMRWLLLMRQ